MKNNTLKFIWVWAMLCSTWLLAETRSHEVKGEVNATSKKLSKKQNIKKKSPVGYDEPNYLFSYSIAGATDARPWSNTIVLVKNHVPVSAALLYRDYGSNNNESKEIPRFIDLDKAEDLALVMDIIKGKKCQKGESNKFDAAHFPITIERCSIAYDSKSKTCEYGEPRYGSLGNELSGDEPTFCGDPHFYFTHYEKVDASYTKIDLQKERFKELARNHKRWRALNLKSYRLVYSPSNTIENVTSEVDNGGFVKQTISHKYSKAYKDTDIPQEERFLVMDDVFAYVKEKLEESSCKVLVEYQIDIKKYWYPHALYVECKGEKLKRIYIDMTVSENKENRNEK